MYLRGGDHMICMACTVYTCTCTSRDALYFAYDYDVYVLFRHRFGGEPLAVQPREDAHCAHPVTQQDRLVWQRLRRQLAAGQEMLRAASRQHPGAP